MVVAGDGVFVWVVVELDEFIPDKLGGFVSGSLTDSSSWVKTPDLKIYKLNGICQITKSKSTDSKLANEIIFDVDKINDKINDIHCNIYNLINLTS